MTYNLSNWRQEQQTPALPKVLQKDLCYEWLGDHQNHETEKRYHVWAQGRKNIPDYYSDYVSGVREAYRAALASWKEQGLIQ